MIQRNAILSWSRLEPRPEILLFGTERGTAAFAEEVGARHMPDVATSEFGTPMLDDMFRRAQAAATHDIVGYANSDIILLQDFADAVVRASAQLGEFLLVGQRWECRIETPLPFHGDWQAAARSEIRAQGYRAGQAAIDYFIFRKGFYADLPPFVIGRPGFDWYLIHAARARGARVVDLTGAATAVHQWHPIAAFNDREAFEREVQHNIQLYQVPWTNLYDATHVLKKGRVRPLRFRRLRKPFWAWQWRRGNPVGRVRSFLRRRVPGAWRLLR